MQAECPHCGTPIQARVSDQAAVVCCADCRRVYPLAALERLSRRRGKTIGGYRLERHLGSGEYSDVWQAEQLATQAKVALKLPTGTSRQHRLWLRREYLITQTLVHPDVTKIQDLQECDGQLLAVCNLIEGESLEHWQRTNPLDVAGSIAIVTQLATILQSIHDSGVIHRDVKPNNIVINGAGKPHITDFGLAVCRSDERVQAMERYEQLFFAIQKRQTGHSIVGTPAYMAPELFVSGTLPSPVTDLYALGVIFYELLTGRHPFESQLATKQRRIQSPRRINLAVGKSVERVCRKSLARDPADRFQSGNEFAAACRDLQLCDATDRDSGAAWRRLWGRLLGAVGRAAS